MICKSTCMIHAYMMLSTLVCLCHRIIDNMPVTWCYEVMDEEKKYCATGFPIGCHVTADGVPRDACVTKVSNYIRMSKKRT